MRAEYVKAVEHLFGGLWSWRGLIILVLAALFFGWFPDAAKDVLSHVFGKFTPYAMLLASGATLLMLYFQTRKIRKYLTGLDYEVEELEEENLRNVKALIAGFSVPNRKGSELEEYFSKLQSLPPEETLKTLEDSTDGFNWIMQAVLIRKLFQLSKDVKKAVFVPSKESESYKELFRRYLELLGYWKDGLFAFSEPVDYERVDELQKCIRSVIESFEKDGIKEKHVLLDITAGLKTFSITIAALSFGSEAKICYVNRDRKARVFDIRYIQK